MEKFRQILRPIKHTWLKGTANLKAKGLWPNRGHFEHLRIGFILGCGRSGTTIFGSLFQLHPSVCYFHEPYHLWAAVERQTDVTNLHYVVKGRYFLDATDCNLDTLERFRKVFGCGYIKSKQEILLEKTPHNIARIGFLEALTEDARYIHIVRNGIDVASSIGRIGRVSSYRIMGKPYYNQWWGNHNNRWLRLREEGSTRGYFPSEVCLLESDIQKGAYEWLVSLGEAERWRRILKGRFYELTYDRFTDETRDVLMELCEFLELNCMDEWLDNAVSLVSGRQHASDTVITLPPQMCSKFNEYQQLFGFSGRAVLQKVDV